MSDPRILLAALLHAHNLGFERATSSTAPQALRNFRPNGATAMRDAIAEGAMKMLTLQALFINSEL